MPAWTAASAGPALLAFPLCAVMAVTIQPLVATLLGPVWQPSGVAALPLIALTAWLFLAFPTSVAVIARGEARTILIANLAGTVATVAGVLLIRPATPLHAVLVWLGAQAFVSPYLLLANARVLRTTPLRLLRAGVPMLAASLLATVAAFVVPQAIGEPESPVWLLVFRLAIVAAIGIPRALLTAAPIGLFAPRLGSAVIAIFLDDLHAVPAPIDAVPADQAVFDLHRFDEVHLIAIGRLRADTPRSACGRR